MSKYFFQLKNYLTNKIKAFMKKPLLLEIFTGAFFSILIVAISVSGHEKEVLKTDFDGSEDYIYLGDANPDNFDYDSENSPGFPEYERGDAMSKLQESVRESSAISRPNTNRTTVKPTSVPVTPTPVVTEIPVTPTPEVEEDIEEVPVITIAPEPTVEPTPEVILDPNGPVIVANMEQAHQTSQYSESITVTGYNSQGIKLPKENFVVKLNEVNIFPELVYNESISYRLDYLEGINNLKVIVTDENYVEKIYDFVIVYVKSEEPTAVISVDADSIGMGYMVPPTTVNLEEGKTVGYYVKELLKANSFFTYGSGSQSNNYKFRGLYRSDLYLKTTPTINDEMLVYLLSNNPDLGFSMDNYYNNFIKNGYFTEKSEWIFEINGERYFDYMSNYTLNDGDVLKVRFTLDSCKDLDWLNDYYTTETIIESSPIPSESIIE